MKGATVVIIGGGAVGSGILRDLSMRGVPALLLEQGGIAHGTSSRFHGLLHSGGRYAVSDNEAAAECIAENTILRRIGRQCVQESEGFFVLTEEDDPAYVDKWIAGCAKAGIPTQELSVEEALRMEPALSPNIRRVFQVPDGCIDGFRLVLHNAMSAHRLGGRSLTYHQVTGICTEGGRVTGVDAVNRITGEAVHIDCQLLVNAAGSWSGKVASLAGLDVPVTPDKGTLLIFNHRFTSHVVNRLHKSSDGDIFVPHGSITILGTTSRTSKDPDDSVPTTEEALHLIKLGRPLFPAIDEYRILRAFAGTRPLYTPSKVVGRAASRGFHIIDHAVDGLEGFVSILGGKFTTYRLMAEKLSDVVCKKLGVSAPCRTADEPIIPDPSPELLEKAKKIFLPQSVDLVAQRLADDFEPCVEKSKNIGFNPFLCECEMVSLAEVDFIARDPLTHSINDIRLRTRLGMGTCQGTFCTLRTAAALTERRIPFETAPLKDIRNFLSERWKGVRSVYWGQLAKEMEMTRAIYCATLHIDAEDGPAACSCPVDLPAPACTGRVSSVRAKSTSRSDVVVVGAGLAGLVAALVSARQGKDVTVISAGAGALNIGPCTIDVLGSTQAGMVTGDPLLSFGDLPSKHPYNLLGMDKVRASLRFLQQLAGDAGWTLSGMDSDGTCRNSALPTSLGTEKISCLVPCSLDSAPLQKAARILVCGIQGIRDCTPGLAVYNLRQNPSFANRELVSAWLESPVPGGYRTTTALDVARALESKEYLDAMCKSMAQSAKGFDAVLVPPVMGTSPDNSIFNELSLAAGCPVLEMATLPPVVTGIRLARLLIEALRHEGVTFVENTRVYGYEAEGDAIKALLTRHEDGARRYVATRFIIATGGIFSGGLAIKPGKAVEPILGIEFALPSETSEWIGVDVASPQPFARLGVPVLPTLEPTLDGKTPLFTNVRYAGRSIGGYDPSAEKSGNGVALATGYQATETPWM